MHNILLEKIRNREVALGAWINSTDPLIAEIFATFGCDWIFIDTEHEAIGRRDLVNILLALKGTPGTPLVRVPTNAPEHIKWVLDAGAGGVVIPQIHGADDVRDAVRYARYAPQGERGAGALRASQYGKDADYCALANSETVLMIEIENIQAARNLDAILQVDGFDAIFIGPMDFAQSMGHLNNPDNPDVQKEISNVIQRSVKAGMPVGITVRDAKDIEMRLKQGVTLCMIGSDYGFVRQGIKGRLAEAKKVLEELK